MIKLIRVDHRLLHGQVAVSWYGSIGANCILIANDAAATDMIRKSAIKMAKPAGAKLVIQSLDKSISSINSGITDKYELMIVVESIHDAYYLLKQIKSKNQVLNLGGTAATAETEVISPTINVTLEDKKELQELKEMGIEISIQQVPSDSKKYPEF